MRSLKISGILIAFAVVVTLGLVTSIGIQFFALEKLKVNGPIYNDVVNGKDLIADILPPPLYVIESYMLAGEAVNEADLMSQNIAKITALKASYEERRSYWHTSSLPQSLKAKLRDDVLRTGDAFWEHFEGNYLAAVKSRDTAALQAALKLLGMDFRLHDERVRELVDLSAAYTTDKENQARSLNFWLERSAMVGSALSVILFLSGIWFLRRRAIAPLGTISSYMSVLASGDYSKEVPFIDRGDEIGSIANSVEVFRAAALERQRLRTETEEHRLRAEAARLEHERLVEIEANDLTVVMDSLGAGLGRLAECNIRMTLDEPFAGKFEPLRSHFNNAISEFQGTLEQVLGKTALLSQSSQEMREAADNLAKRTEQQATALEQTSAALEEVSSTVKSSVDRTMETRAIVKQARECATSSSTVVRQAVSAMQRIEGASREITSIIDVIDQIAFQTNLLALNAGVEAARAGEAGRGFAVVAQEVRELSQRSAIAAKQISDLISNTTQEIANGVVLVNETGTALTAIETFVASIDEQVDAVATTAREQSIGLQDISAAVTSIDRMTQQNAAMVVETSALSLSLDADSQDLAELAKRFKLNRRATIRDSSGVIVSVKRQAA